MMLSEVSEKSSARRANINIFYSCDRLRQKGGIARILHFDVFCDPFTNTDAQQYVINLFSKMNKQKLALVTSSMPLSSSRSYIITKENTCAINFIM